MAHLFEVGDRVASQVDYGAVKIGDLGVICVLGSSIGVCWDKPHHSFHSCGNVCEPGYGYYMYDPRTLKLIKPLGPPDEGDDWI